MNPGSCMLVNFPVAIKKIPGNSNLVKDGAISAHRIRKSTVHPGGEDTVTNTKWLSSLHLHSGSRGESWHSVLCFCLVWDASPWGGAAHLQVFPCQLNFSGNVLTGPLRGVSPR